MPLGGNLIDVLRLQLTAAKELAPFLHEKRPVGVSVESKSLRIVIHADPDDLDPDQQAAVRAVVREIVEKQEDSEE